MWKVEDSLEEVDSGANMRCNTSRRREPGGRDESQTLQSDRVI